MRYAQHHANCNTNNGLFRLHSGWISTIHTSLIAPNFTEYGWAVTRSPEVSYDNILKIYVILATICQLTSCFNKGIAR